MCAEHPELKDTIARGINEEWFTYKDVAAFEKDTVALIAMLEKNAEGKCGLFTPISEYYNEICPKLRANLAYNSNLFAEAFLPEIEKGRFFRVY